MARRLMFASVLLLTFAIAAWAGKDFRLTAAAAVPAAQGKVSIDHDHNGNDVVHMEVKHLAQPSALTPAKANYVVWIQARGKDPEPQGMLRVNDKEEGAFETTTPYKTFDIFVTAEDTPNPTTPSGPEVMRGTIQE